MYFMYAYKELKKSSTSYENIYIYSRKKRRRPKHALYGIQANFHLNYYFI